jgi:16S rRNA (cytosine967-C5)-methyltransferase
VPRPDPRQCALDVLHAAAARPKRFVDEILDQHAAAAGLSHADRAFVMELVYGATRRRLTLDWLIERYSKRPLDTLDAQLRLIVQLALYQLLFMDTVPDYAAVNEAVETAKRRIHAGAAKFANGLLRAVLRAKDALPYPSPDDDLAEHIAVVHSHPRWLVRRWLEQFGRDRTIEICTADNLAPPVTLRANTLKITRDQLIDHLRAEQVEAEPADGDESAVRVRTKTPLAELETYRRGEFYVQDVSAMRVARLLDPQPGERVLDLCAAPGGKTTHCAELMHDEGRLVACDLDEKRLDVLRANVARLGLTCIEPARCDARHLPQLIPTGAFDRVLLDVPCSNTGVLRRRVEARWRIAPEDIASLAARQAELLETAHRMLRTGGILVYSTCSVEPEENDQTVRAFLSRHGEYRIEHEELILPTANGPDGAYMARITRHG